MPQESSREVDDVRSEKEPAQILRVDSLSLNNYRCFAECKFEFHPRLTVLVAENAQGKTYPSVRIRYVLLLAMLLFALLLLERVAAIAL